MAGTLTALGRRTLDGYQRKYGVQEGERKFEAALASGVLERSRMEHASGERGSRLTVPAYVTHPKGLEANAELVDKRQPVQITLGERTGDPGSAAPLRKSKDKWRHQDKTDKHHLR